MKQTGVTSVYKSGTWAEIPLRVLVIIAYACLTLPAFSQDAIPQANSGGVVDAAPVIPQQVRYSGKLATRTGDTVEAVFSIYAAPEGGEPLWTETQKVTVDVDGAYTVLLGSASLSGVPETLFAGGAARWLGVSVERAPELARVLLSSVPYAMKSADAQALAGHPAGDFVTQGQLSEQLSQFAETELHRAPDPEVQPLTSGTITGSGTTGTIPQFTGANTIGNSEMVQVGSDIGINQPTPAATLDVNGTGQFEGTLTLPPLATATSAAGQHSQVTQWTASAWSSATSAAVNQTFRMFAYPLGNDTATPSGEVAFQYQLGTVDTNIFTIGSNGLMTSYGGLTITPPNVATASTPLSSPPFELGGSSYSSATSSAVHQNFAWQVVPTGNDTSTPSSYLALLYGSGFNPLAATGLSISPKGIINWATGQTFPITGTGGGTITGITTTSPLTGSGTSGSVALGFNTSALETTLNAVYPQLNSQNTFSNNNNFVGTIGSQGTLDLESTGITSPYAPNLNSALLELSANAYNSNEGIPEALNFGWQSVATGGNTSSPSANLELLYGSGSTQPAATGLSIAPSGIITFASGQTFPGGGGGGGGITGITTSSPLTGSGTSGSVALGLNETTLSTDLEPTYDSRYALLSGGNIFSNYIEASSAAGNGNAAISSYGSNGTAGTYGQSDTGFGLEGESKSGQGVSGQVTAPVAGSSGVLGLTGYDFSSTYASESPLAYAGIWADTSAPSTSAVGVALFATADDAFAGVFASNGASFPTLRAYNSGGAAGEFSSALGDGVNAFSYSGNGVNGETDGGGDGVSGYNLNTVTQEAGVYGQANTNSVIGGKFKIYSGVWGDTGTSSTTVAPVLAAGVLGTADDGPAGVFFNNSSSFTTLIVSNSSGGGTSVASTGVFNTLMASSPDGTCGIGSGGSLSCTGQVKSIVSTSGGSRKVETYAMQSPENWMEDFGSGELQNGVAVVNIDPTFADTVSESADYHVFITPDADSKGLYVINKTTTSFEVRESGGGTSTLTFDYRIVAKRRGYETLRHLDVTDRYNAEMKAATMARGSGIVRKPTPLAKSPLLAALGTHPRTVRPLSAPTPHRSMNQPANTPIHP